MLIVRGEVTNNQDPLMLGRIKFKSTEFLGGLEHPNWVDPAIPYGGDKCGIYFIPPIGEPVFIIIPSDAENHTPIYLACHPTQDRAVDEIKEGYPNRAIIKFEDMGYILFDKNTQRITINSTGNIDVVAAGCIKLDAPLTRATRSFEVGQAASGTFTTSDGKLVMVDAGIITAIV